MKRLFVLAFAVGCGSEFQAETALEVEAGTGGQVATDAGGSAGDEGGGGDDAAAPVYPCAIGTPCTECLDAGQFTEHENFCGGPAGGMGCQANSVEGGGLAYECMPTCSRDSECESECCNMRTPGQYLCMPVGYRPDLNEARPCIGG